MLKKSTRQINLLKLPGPNFIRNVSQKCIVKKNSGYVLHHSITNDSKILKLHWNISTELAKNKFWPDLYSFDCDVTVILFSNNFMKLFIVLVIWS